jgi:hypothetical protein
VAVKKPLVLGSDGSIEQLQAGDTLDITMPDSSDTILLTMAEAANMGEVVCATASGMVKADKDDPTKVRVVGIASETIASGDQGNVKIFNQIGGLSGLTAGSPVYLDTAGAMSTSVPTSGHAVRLGLALSANDLLIEIAQPIRL